MGDISVMKLEKLQVAGVFADFSLSQDSGIYRRRTLCVRRGNFSVSFFATREISTGDNKFTIGGVSLYVPN